MAGNRSTRKPKAEQALKDREVLQLRAAGATLQEIADRHFSGHRANAHRALTRIMSSHVAEGVNELRAVENVRLDRLQMAHWTQALSGHLGATKVVLNVMERRAKLNGLDTQVEQAGGGNITVMLDGNLMPKGMSEPDVIVDAPLGDDEDA